MPMGGWHRMVVNRQMREGAAVKASDTMKVVMECDEAERTVEVPAVRAKELKKSKTAAANWEKHSYTHQKEMARWITEAKQEETRARRFAKVIEIVKGGKKWMG